MSNSSNIQIFVSSRIDVNSIRISNKIYVPVLWGAIYNKDVYKRQEKKIFKKGFYTLAGILGAAQEDGDIAESGLDVYKRQL